MKTGQGAPVAEEGKKITEEDVIEVIDDSDLSRAENEKITQKNTEKTMDKPFINKEWQFSNIYDPLSKNGQWNESQNKKFERPRHILNRKHLTPVSPVPMVKKKIDNNG